MGFVSKARIKDSVEEEFADIDPRFGGVVSALLKASEYTKRVEVSNFSEGFNESCDRSLWPTDHDSNETLATF